MADEMSFDVDNNAWLLTLPETRTGERYFPPCTIVVIRTLRDIHVPVGDDPFGEQLLKRRECTLSLFWHHDGRRKERQFVATFRVEFLDRKTKLDLTNDDFILDDELRGRGLGSWIMQQLICWARTLPADTPVRRIETSPVDEEDSENRLRRDRLWQGIGFRFRNGSRQSLPVNIHDLHLPAGRHSPLTVVPLHLGVEALARTAESQRQELITLKALQSRHAERIMSLTERQWDVLLINGFGTLLLSPVQLLDWLYRKVKRKKTDRSA